MLQSQSFESSFTVRTYFLKMKIVLNRFVNERKVINTEFGQRAICVNYRARHQDIRIRKYYPPVQQRSGIKTRDWRTKKLNRDWAIAKEKFASLSVDNTPTEPNCIIQKEHQKESAGPSVIQLKEPVLQNYLFKQKNPAQCAVEEASSTSKTGGESPMVKLEPRISNEALVEMFKCRMCPNYAAPEIYECSASGHTICNECWLLESSHCTLCPDESIVRRSFGMERIASLLSFACRWAYRGCTESLGAAAWRNHVESCHHRAKVRFRPLASASQVDATDAHYEIDSNVNDL